MFLSFSRNSQIAQKIPRFLISHIAQNSTHYCPKFLPFDEYIPTVMFVHIVQWYLTADFSTLIHPITPKITPKLVYFGSKSFVKLLILRIFPNEMSVLLEDLPHISCKNVRNTTCPRYTTSEHTVIVKYYGMFLYWIVSILVTI